MKIFIIQLFNNDFFFDYASRIDKGRKFNILDSLVEVNCMLPSRKTRYNKKQSQMNSLCENEARVQHSV